MESDKKESIIQGFPWLQGSRVKYLLWFIAAAWVYSLSFIIQNYWAKYASYPSITRQYQQQLKGSHRTFEGLLANEDLLKRIAFGTTTEADNYYLQNLPFKLFLYQSPRKADRLIYWSSNTVLPPEWMVDNGVSGTVFKYGNGQYEIIRKPITINGLPFTAIALVPLYQQFFIENARLHKGFPGFKGMENRMEYSEKATPYPINGIANEPLFYLKPVSDQPFTVFSWSGMVVQILAALLVFLGISHIAAQYFKYRLVIQGLLVFGLSFMGLWILVKKFGIPINIGQLGQLQGYDALARPPDNLLSLVQNGVFGIWLALFLTFHSTVIIQYIQKASRLWLRMLATLLALGMVMLHYVLIVFISRLYLNTAIAFDLNNFFSLDYTTVLAFVLLFALAIMHLLLTRFAVRTMVVLLVGGVWVMVGVVAVMGLFVLSTPLFQEFKLELLFSLVWLLLFALYIGSTRHPAFPVTSGRLVLWLFVYAFSIGLLLGGLSAKRLRQRVYDVGQNLLMQNDRTSEYLVRIAAAGARRLPWPSLIKQAADSVRCRQIADSVRNRFFGEYLARYQTEVYLYNQNKEPLGGTSTPGFETLNTLFERQAIQSDIPWLSYFEEAYDRFGYLIKFEVTEPGNATPAGTVFIVTRYVLLRNTLLAPELFKQIQDFAVDLPPGLSYAWYRKGTLVEQYRNYPFYAGLPEEINGQQSFWENQTETAIEIWFNASKDTVLAVAGARRLMIGLVSMVAYIFCAFLVMFILIRGTAAIFQHTNLNYGIFRSFRFTIQSQIRLTIIAILFISFLIIAYITIRFFVGQYQQANEEKLSRTIQHVYADITLKIPDDFLQMPDTERASFMREQLTQLAKAGDADINFYDSRGKLLATTQDILFTKQVLGGIINPEAYRKLTYGKLNRFIAREKIGDLEYISIYQPLRSTNRDLVGYLQVPFFSSQSELNQEISNFVVILINIIAFVFLLSGGLALWISGGITRSFSLIAQRMKEIRLSERNERIEWYTDDEIGNLVHQYNRMVDQLEESAALLAKSERETAWREMARQVAHEIKNPLTPMKLSLQYLQKTIEENRTDVAKITDRVAATLVSQIDHLSNIAAEFSQFANIGNTRPELFDLHTVLKDLVQLYALQQDIQVQWRPVNNPVWVMADKTQMNRLFTNLLQNAYEARGHQNAMIITLSETLEESYITIAVQDNGPGIPPSIQERIFMPNFTTKTSGTGLGLAICKAIVENAQGHIWFDTTAENGTCFYVKLPVYHP